MMQNILKYYIPKANLRQRITPLKLDVVGPDYFLYLCTTDKTWYVIVETDYPFIEEIVNDAEGSFPVNVVGWRTLLEYQEKGGDQLLPIGVFDNINAKEPDEANGYYHAVALKEQGTVYLLLEVEPANGAVISDFGLSFYSDKHRP